MRVSAMGLRIQFCSLGAPVRLCIVELDVDPHSPLEPSPQPTRVLWQMATHAHTGWRDPRCVCLALFGG